jgi:hypothetical protein
MFGSSLPPVLFVVGLMFYYLRYLCLFGHSGVQHILYFVFCFEFLCLVSAPGVNSGARES